MEDSFYEITRFIMSKEEIKIFRHLPDEKLKTEFQKEFWEKRDPSPETEENESKMEFEKRIEFANKWFKDRPDGRGWDTERGHLLLQLGIPNQRQISVTTIQGTTWTVMVDEWYYGDYDLYLQFADDKGQGKYVLQNWPPELLEALDRAVLALDLNDTNAPQNNFTFNAKFKKENQQIEIKIPVKHIEWEALNDHVHATFDIQVNAYLNYKKINEFKNETQLDKTKTEILTIKHLIISIPYAPRGKGKYFLEVIIKDRNRSFRYRNFCQFKI